jgi:hypothetical protein
MRCQFTRLRVQPLLIQFTVIATTSLFVPLGPTLHAQTTIQKSSAKATVTLGSAYRSEKETLIGGSCVTGASETAGLPTSTFSFETPLRTTSRKRTRTGDRWPGSIRSGRKVPVSEETRVSRTSKGAWRPF